jgi:hypothetical protein
MVCRSFAAFDRSAAPNGLLLLRLPLLLLVLSTASACTDDAQFTTRFASDFVPGRHAVSVLGVFKDGQMSSEAWESIGPKLSAPFGATCDTAYAALVASDQTLSSAIDDYVRANGPGDDLLEQLVPNATGDVIVVFTVAGHVNGKAPAGPDTGPVSTGGSAMPGGRSRGMRPTGSQGTRGMARPSATGAFEISASLYSVGQKRSVGLLAMRYDGISADDALQRMATRLALALPGATCGGWDWKAKVDDHRIRALIEE